MNQHDRILRALVHDAAAVPPRSPERLAAVKRVIDFEQRVWPLKQLVELQVDLEHVIVEQETEVVLDDFRTAATIAAAEVERALLLLRATSPLLDRTITIDEAERRAGVILDAADRAATVTPISDWTHRERLAA